MTDLESFDPRAAALHHAAMMNNDDLRNHATAIACGLIYVGDQLRHANRLAEGQLLRDHLEDSVAPRPELVARLRELSDLLWPEGA